jgi:3-hydroxyisobutyrate dehydrogenase-like beta-hydroxyacid dehydrogenase
MIMKVAWIGLGDMGLPTALKIARAGHEVKGYDVKPPLPEHAEGITLTSSAFEAAKECDVLCLMVFSDAQVEEVLSGPNGIMNHLKPRAVIAIFTTGSIESACDLAAKAPAGTIVLDTCFSRMHRESASGLLTLLVGGDAEGITRARPVFEAFAREIIHVGPSGSGRAIKLVNNILYAGHLQLAADALHFAQGLGLEPKATANALIHCSGESNVMEQLTDLDATMMVETAHRYMVKDVKAAAEAAKMAGIELGALLAATRTYLSE